MKIKIVSTSDVHGYIYPTNFTSRNDYHGLGYLKAGAVIEKIRAKQNKTGIPYYTLKTGILLKARR